MKNAISKIIFFFNLTNIQNNLYKLYQLLLISFVQIEILIPENEHKRC